MGPESVLSSVENTNFLSFFLVFSYGTFFPMVAPEAEWVEEFQDITDEDVEATFSRQHDFWNKLEDEWKESTSKNRFHRYYTHK